MSEGYSGTPLLQKLGVKAGQAALLIGVPETIEELDRFSAFAERVDVRSLAAREFLAACSQGPFDYIHVFEREALVLEAEIEQLRGALVPHGMIWVSWPKRASKMPTTITEDVVRAIALEAGLVDVKVCAVDSIWSGLKLVIPRAQRLS